MGRIVACLTLLAAAAAADSLSWHKTWEAALAEAKRHRRPILVYVYDDY